MAEMPTPDLAVPYAAPKQVKTMADVQPIAPKNGFQNISYVLLMVLTATSFLRRKRALSHRQQPCIYYLTLQEKLDIGRY